MNRSMTVKPDWGAYQEVFKEVSPVTVYGKVNHVVGMTIEACGIDAFVGELCDIYTKGSDLPIRAEVIGFRDDCIVLMPLGDLQGIGPG